ncbi:MAG TPA: S53 family peptidase [Trebonia sp.]|nr:S53 family peptidase [Trebonia sp.]
MLRQWTFVTFIGAFIALLGLLGATLPSGAASGATRAAGPPVALTASAAPGLPAGAVRLGTVSSGTRLTVEVTLNVADQAALTAFLSGLSNPASPDYQHYLTPGQFGPLFGPSPAQVAAVENALRGAGLSPGAVAPDRLSIPVTATAAAIERAFGVTLASYRLTGGRRAFGNVTAPEIPAAVAPLVQGVIGLSDLYPEQHLDATSPASAAAARARLTGPQATVPAGGRLVPATNPGPQPCGAISDGLSGVTAYGLSAHYGLAQLYALGDEGQGTRIAVAELEPNLTSDIAAYKACYGIATHVNYFKLDGGAGSGAGQGEAALDIETLAGLAPKATIDVYQAPNTGGGPGEGLYDIIKTWANGDRDKVLSVSWGSCEAKDTAADVKAQETLFEQANAQGQTAFAAAGDNGSTGCSTDAKPNAKVSATSPASEPYVISVGGTSLADNSSGITKEVAWNDSNDLFGEGAGGGGVSALWCMPKYQDNTAIPGLINGHSVKDASSSCSTKYRREAPDVSALADPDYGYAVLYDGGWVPIGGTSAATPLWAAVAALTDASPFCAAYASKGTFLPQKLYAVAATYHRYIYTRGPQGLDDVTSGNNDYTPSGYSGGLYPATKGYDMATGLGTPMVAGLSGVYGGGHGEWFTFLTGLTQLMCHNSASRAKTVHVTRVVPSTGAAGQATRVTVHGSGFLPITSADEAQVIFGGKVLATLHPACSAGACTLTMPAESARTVNIKIFASSLWSSPLVKADRYTYKKK